MSQLKYFYDEFDSIKKGLDSNSEIIEDLVDKITYKHCSGIDEYVTNIHHKLSNNNYTTYDLEQWSMRLPVFLYNLGYVHERIGVREDMANMIKTEAYNMSFTQSEGSQAVKKSKAEIDSIEEIILHMAHQRAYKMMKAKIDHATELLHSIKKVLSKRMIELELTRIDPN